ncbi:hypothetical protein [Streptomyces cupreus]|uniref:Lipoprotein n=1 Tax=Streptomyces cupreus TaxID=2759956 RepID=A0A7X1IZD9_9ACTN|nr:hypothetical protein [Streptomyces cupreus]MBC2901378.1 hypothetical protein [Streptomyces cupreus]
MAVRALISAAVSATLLLAPAAVAAAPAGDDPTAQELADEAEDNLLDAKSVHLKLTDRSAGTETSRTQPTSMDLALDRSGNCVGTMEMGSDGGSVEIVKRGEEVWMKPDTAFWKAQVPGGEGDAVAELFKNRYIHGSTDDALLKGMADTCDLNNFQRDVGTDSSPGATSLKKGEETTRDGTKVIPLEGELDGARTTLYVTSDSPHLLVEATQRGDDTDVRLTFSEYDEPVPTETPSADETVDIGKLQDELQSI